MDREKGRAERGKGWKSIREGKWDGGKRRRDRVWKGFIWLGELKKIEMKERRKERGQRGGRKGKREG